MAQKITLKTLSEGNGPEYILFNLDKGAYKVWATSEKFPLLVDELLNESIFFSNFTIQARLAKD